MEEINISAAIEAILFSSGDSVEKSRIAQALEITEKQVDETVDKLIDDYSAQNRGITII
ncbi:MAG: SMC-Scp complex subunit ScpB [Ruminococcus sp.]|nr:SMC-Scp complex subunit ScpB [Ruminococcus sp.]